MKYVIGLGKTGMSLTRYLLQHNFTFIVWDDTPLLQEKAQLMGRAVVAPNQAPWHLIEELILSPGIPIVLPSPHLAVQLAKKYNVPFRGDVDLWYQSIQHLGCKVIGITGTNGKSTTHAIIDHILNKIGLPHFSGGNSGVPVFDATDIPKGAIINLEMSSYQLDILDKMKFDVGIVLNITPDHLDRYGNIENYIVSKQIQIKRVKPNGLKIMGIDTSYSMQAYKHLLNVGHTDIVPISALQVLPKGIYAKDNKVYSSEQGTEVLLGTIPDILPGAHNAENVMAAMLACRFVGMDTSEFFKLLPLYQGLEHRQERVLETEKVLCINDSKATNADATLPALKTYKNIYWIVGGIAKEEGVIPLLSYLNNVEKILLIGESASRFQEELKPVSNKIITVDTLESAVAFIEKELNVIDHKITVLLSPTCASQDQFQNFEHRGKVFKALVQERFRVS